MKQRVKTTVKMALINLAVILSLCVGAIFAVVPQIQTAAAEGTASVWNGDFAAAGWGDTGASKTPAPTGYTLDTTAKTLAIGTADAFAYFSHEVYLGTENGFTGYTVTLESDIDLNNKAWLPIGFTYRGKAENYNRAFKGIFDGKSHTIFNFSGTNFLKAVEKNGSDYYITDGNVSVEFPLKSGEEFHYGLFGVICGTKDGETDYVVTIKNLTIDNFEFDFGADGVDDALPLIADVGAFVGFSNNSFLIENCKTGGGYIKGAKKYAENKGRMEVSAGILARSYAGDGSVTNNTLVRSFINCENNIDVDLDDGDVTQRAAGIFAFHSGAGEVNYINCVNNGDVKGAVVGGFTTFSFIGTERFENSKNTGDITSTNGEDVGNFYGSVAGGFVAFFHNGNTILKNCVNEGNISSTVGEDMTARVAGFIAVVGAAHLTVENCVNKGNITNESNGTKRLTQTYSGVGSFTAGLIGLASINSNSSVKSFVNYGKISYATAETNAELIYAGDCFALVAGDAPTTMTYEDDVVSVYAPQAISARNTENEAVAAMSDGEITELTGGNGLLLEENGSVLVGIADSVDDGNYKIVVPATVTKIKENAFFGMGEYNVPRLSGIQFVSAQTKFVKEVDLSLAVKLTEIGDMAFAGTDITSIALPASVEKIGLGAFAQTKLVSVVIPASVKSVGQAAFGNISALKQVQLLSDETEFGADVFNGAADGAFVIVSDSESYSTADFKDILTHAVTVEYFNYDTNSVADSELKLFGQPYEMICTDGIWSLGNIDYVGTVATNANETVWYSDAACTTVLDEVDKATQAIANTTADVIRFYTKNIGNSAEFIARADLVYDGTEYSVLSVNALLTANSKKVTDENVAFKKGDETVDVICDAGVYTVIIGSEEIEVTVAKAAIDLTSAANLVWRVNGNITMLDRTLYIYDSEDGGKYPSLSALENGKVDGVDVSSEQVKTVIDSVVRARGTTTLTLGLTEGRGYTASGDGATASGVGMYTSVFTLTADANHELTVGGTLTNAAARGLTVEQGAGGAYTVTKVWYVVEMDNWFVGSDGSDYAIADRSYGSVAAIAAPRIANGSDALEADTVTFTLMYNNTALPDFHSADFGKYLNNMMPAGSYTLIMSAKEFDYEVEDNEAPGGLNMITLHSGAFTQSVSFEVTATGVDSLVGNQFDKITAALNGKTFEFIVGSAEMSAANASVQTAVTAALEEIKRAMPASDISGNYWTTDYVGSPALEFNPAYAMINSYADAFVKPTAAGVYTYYYKVTALNYEDAAADANGKLFAFTVAAYEYVDLPGIADLAKTYTGEKLTADVVGTDKYTILENNGGVNVGAYDVVFELVHPEYTLWTGKTLADKVSTYTVDFIITKAVNEWIEAPDIVRWVEGEYNADENTFIGAAKFGTIVYVVTDADDNVYYDSSNNINKLASLKAGTYNLRATVVGNDNYNGLSEAFTVKVLEAEGLPWWAILLIVIGALGVAAVILWILHEKGVLQMLSGKIVIAIRTKMTCDATIAAVRANKRAEEAKKSIAKAEAEDRAEEARRKREQEAALPPEERAALLEERAAALEEKAQKRAEQAAKRAEKLKKQAQKLKGEDEAEQSADETPADEQPASDAAATESDEE